jgi:hypothetical protein
MKTKLVINTLMYLTQNIAEVDQLNAGEFGKAWTRRNAKMLAIGREPYQKLSELAKYMSESMGNYPVKEVSEEIENWIVEAFGKSLSGADLRSNFELKIGRFKESKVLTRRFHVGFCVKGINARCCSEPIGEARFVYTDEVNFVHLSRVSQAGHPRVMSDSPPDNFWLKSNQGFLNQNILLVVVEASDVNHAVHRGRQKANEILNLFRYGFMVTSQDGRRAPRFGSIAQSIHDFETENVICFSDESNLPLFETRTSVHDDTNWTICSSSPAWESLCRIVGKSEESLTDIQDRILHSLGWVGEAALSESLKIRLVALVTAIECLVFLPSETTGKKMKMTDRLVKMSKFQDLVEPVDNLGVEQTYVLRSKCVHGGIVELNFQDVNQAFGYLIMIYKALLENEELRKMDELSDVLDYLQQV